jgi:hypothetical protein
MKMRSASQRMAKIGLEPMVIVMVCGYQMHTDSSGCCVKTLLCVWLFSLLRRENGSLPPISNPIDAASATMPL